MPTFHYTAKKGPTDIVEGLLEAETRTDVLSRLNELGYVPIRVNVQTVADQAAKDGRRVASLKPSRIPFQQMTVFTRQFASLTRSQVPLLRTLQILEEQTRHAYFLHVIRALAEDVRQGQTISSAMSKFPRAFSPLYVNLIHSGEISGALDVILEQLAEQAEREESLRAKVRAAFTYPLFVGVVGCGTVVFLMTFVMPRLSKLLAGLGNQLPAATRLLLAIAGWMSTGWFWAGIIAAAVAAMVVWRVSGERGRLLLDGLVLRTPILGQVIKELELARFARSFGLLLNHGISVLKAMEVTIPIVGNRVIRRQLERLPDALRQGGTLSTGLKQMSMSTPFLVNTVAVGEESGNVGNGLTEVANYYERDVERLLQTMATLLEPTLIVAVGLVVGFIVIAVLLPIFEMSSISR